MSRARAALLQLIRLTPRALVWRFARTYIAGETLEEALEAIRELENEGCRATLDVLGEDVTTPEEVERYAAEYLRALEAIAENGLDANVSIKPTAMGLKLDPALALETVARIAGRASELGMTVRLDMEDSSVTEATLALQRGLESRGHRNVGVVLQAYLRRTLDDVRRLAAAGASVRICKGIYVEPREIAYQDFEIVRESFVDALGVLLRAPACYAAIATHDEWLVQRALSLLADHAVSRDRYEFQMLLGVDAQLRRLILRAGHPLRVYVPYGRGWFPYSTRRLIENPRLAAHVVRNVLGFGAGSREGSPDHSPAT